jgi:AcrR family transcriptional regulator
MRKEILDSATRLFAAQGVAGTAIQEVADAVGIRKPSLLYYFGNKEGLRDAVLEELLGHWREALPRLLQAATGEDQFEAVIGELVDFFQTDPDRARLLFREMLDRPDYVRALVLEHVLPWIEVVCRHVRRGQEQGAIRPSVDPEAYAFHIIVLVIGGIAAQHDLKLVSNQRHRAELMRIAHDALFQEQR